MLYRRLPAYASLAMQRALVEEVLQDPVATRYPPPSGYAGAHACRARERPRSRRQPLPMS